MKSPDLHPSLFQAQGSIIKGNVSIDEDSSIWYNAVIRSEISAITIGKRCNVQDNATIHTDPDHGTEIGDDVSIGHNAVIHGAKIEDRVIIGMGAIIMNGAVIPSDCIVAAGSLVPQDKTFPSGSLILGSPAKAVRALSEQEKQSIIDNSSRYIQFASLHQQCL